MLRVEAMRWACEAGVEKCTSYAEKTYQQWLKNPEMKLDVNLKTEILCAGVRKASESEWTDTLEYIITSKLDEDDKKDLLMALACSNSSEILMTYLNSTLEPSYPIDFKTGVKNVVSKYPAGAELVSKFLFKENKRIRQIANFESVIEDVASIIGGAVTTQEQHFELNAFFMERQLMHQLIHATVDATTNMIWIMKYRSTIDEWLGANSNLFENPDNG
ncbi:aminopeptidase Q-like, partial [Ceratina calcarata]|uniref:Aminopeptidase Q-like n=1 Tax=Ceratina calcarata TaxID=156304 RepID=A0AAJ7SCQ3_9HYME